MARERNARVPKRQWRRLTLRCAVWAGAPLAAVAAYGQIVPTGTTATQVQASASGGVAVTPARPINDVSYNAFRQFDVQATGATIRNGDVKARTIVAEVFGTTPSRIEGPVTLEGPRANFILANQNGIQVNGGHFANFGSLALTTGAVTLRDEQLAPGQAQRYVDLTTRAGRIDIGPGGLEADVIRLELVAKTIGLDGAVTNLFSSPTASTRFVAGDSTASFDTLVSPTDNLTPWMRYQSGSASSSQTALAISAASKVSSGRIDIIVTDKGAGVNNAGDLAATHADLVLSATGQLSQNGGSLRSAGAIHIEAASLDQRIQDGRASAIAAGTSLDIRTTGSIASQGGSLTGRINDSTTAAVQLQAGGNVTLETPVGATAALIHASEGDIAIRAGGDIQGINSRIVSNGRLTLEAGGAARLQTSFTGGAGRSDGGGSDLLTRRSHWSVDHGRMNDEAQQGYWVAAGDLNIKAAEVTSDGGRIFSNAGRVDITAIGQVLNQAHLVGSVGYERSCALFICKTRVSSTERAIGGEISAATGLAIQAGWRIVNEGGSVLSLTGMRLQSPQVIARSVQLYQAIERDKGLKALIGHQWGRLYQFDQGGGFTAQSGAFELLGQGVQDGGFFTGNGASQARIDVMRKPGREPVRLEDHLGILWW